MGTDNYFIFLNKLKMEKEKQGDTLLAAGAFVSFIVALVLSRGLIKKQRSISRKMFEFENKTGKDNA